MLKLNFHGSSEQWRKEEPRVAVGTSRYCLRTISTFLSLIKLPTYASQSSLDCGLLYHYRLPSMDLALAASSYETKQIFSRGEHIETQVKRNRGKPGQCQCPGEQCTRTPCCGHWWFGHDSTKYYQNKDGMSCRKIVGQDIMRYYGSWMENSYLHKDEKEFRRYHRLVVTAKENGITLELWHVRPRFDSPEQIWQHCV